MLAAVVLVANACGVTWHPAEALPAEVRAKMQGARVLDPCRVSALPKPIREYLAEDVDGVRLDMAERGASWNFSCWQSAGEPSRQLLAAAQAGRRWVVHYRTGGIGVAEHFVVLETTKTDVRLLGAGHCLQVVPAPIVGATPAGAMAEREGLPATESPHLVRECRLDGNADGRGGRRTRR